MSDRYFATVPEPEYQALMILEEEARKAHLKSVRDANIFVRMDAVRVFAMLSQISEARRLRGESLQGGKSVGDHR